MKKEEVQQGNNTNNNNNKNNQNSKPMTGEDYYKKLPENFAEEIMNLQMGLDTGEKNDLNTIHRLLELYTLGVGHYQSVGDKKYEYFQQKIKNMLTKPQVVNTMTVEANKRKDEEANKLSQELRKREQKQAEEQMKRDLIARQREDLKNQIKVAVHQTDVQVKQVLGAHEQVANQNDRLIQNQLEDQKKSIQQRLQQRKLAKMNLKALSVPDDFLSDDENSRKNITQNGVIDEFMIRQVDDEQEDEEDKWNNQQRKGSVDLMNGIQGNLDGSQGELENSHGDNVSGKLRYSRDSYKEIRQSKTNSLSYSEHFDPHSIFQTAIFEKRNIEDIIQKSKHQPGVHKKKIMRECEEQRSKSAKGKRNTQFYDEQDQENIENHKDTIKDELQKPISIIKRGRQQGSNEFQSEDQSKLSTNDIVIISSPFEFCSDISNMQTEEQKAELNSNQLNQEQAALINEIIIIEKSKEESDLKSNLQAQGHINNDDNNKNLNDSHPKDDVNLDQVNI